MDGMPSRIGRASAASFYAAPQLEHSDMTFAAAMASTRDRGPLWAPGANAASAAGESAGSTLSASALGRQLDILARHRVEAQALSDGIAGAWATRPDVSTLAVAMHRQARAMASYNISVMWGAKLVGVTAGAVRQLATAA